MPALSPSSVAFDTVNQDCNIPGTTCNMTAAGLASHTNGPDVALIIPLEVDQRLIETDPPPSLHSIYTDGKVEKSVNKASVYLSIAETKSDHNWSWM